MLLYRPLTDLYAKKSRFADQLPLAIIKAAAERGNVSIKRRRLARDIQNLEILMRSLMRGVHARQVFFHLLHVIVGRVFQTKGGQILLLFVGLLNTTHDVA